MAFLMPLAAQSQELPAPRSPYVNDFADALSNRTKAELIKMFREAKVEQGRELTVVTIKWLSLYGGHRDLAAFGKALFNDWGVGNAQTNDGVMLLFALNDRQVRIVLGDGYSARYDGLAKRIIDSEIIPQFEIGQTEAGILKGAAAAIDRLDLNRALPPEPSRWERFATWLEEQAPPIFFGIVALAFTSGGWFPRVVRLFRRVLPLKCPECSRKMLRLGNVQERHYLSDGQLLEEKLNSANYDVWICPHDEHVTIKADYSLTSRYKACPDCGYHTCEVHRHTRRAATRVSSGEAEQAYRCDKCGYTHLAIVPIPYLQADGDGRSSARFGGGGRSSGGFGGGSSSGGGASGSW